MTQNSYHHGELETAIIRCAGELLSSDGAGAISLRGIARTLGVSHQAPYRHFAAKSDLLAALRAEGFRRLTASTREAISKHPRSRRRQLEVAATAYVEMAIAEPGIYQLMFGGSIASEKWGDCQASHASESFAALAEIVGPPGESPPSDDTAEKTRVVWACLHGIASLSLNGLLPDDRKSRLSLLRAAIERFVDRE